MMRVFPRDQFAERCQRPGKTSEKSTTERGLALGVECRHSRPTPAPLARRAIVLSFERLSEDSL